MKEVVALTPDDDVAIRAAHHLLTVSFGGSDDGVERYRQTVATCPVLAVREGGELLGVAAIHPYRQWFAGREIAMGGLGGVAVAAHARRRGVATALLAAAIARMRADGTPLSVLYPSTPLLYRASGWEFAGVNASVELPTIGLPSGAPGEVALRALDRDAPAETDLNSIHSLYTAAARTAVGPLTRTGAPFVLARLATLDAVVIASVDGVDAGYVSWSRRGDRLKVHDLIADRPVVRDTLLGCVGSWQTTIGTVQIRLGDPVLGSLGLPNGAALRCEPWMLRVIDAEAAVAARGFGAAEGEVDLVLTDPHAPWLAGYWRLSVAGGVGTLTRGGAGGVALGARGLAALFTGYAGAAGLVAAGLADGPPGALARLAALFAGPIPWMADEF